MKTKRLVSISSVLGSTFCLVFFFGCIGAKKTQQTTTITSAEEPTEDRRFDPLELSQDQEIVPLEYPRTGEIYGRESTADSESLSYITPSVPPESPETIDTLNSQAYRVQLFTSQLYGEARRAATVAEEIFDRIVFLDYEVPYYKVRVGSFAQREEAEDYLQRVKAAGYPDAWVVMVTVGAREPVPLYDVGRSLHDDTAGFEDHER